MIERGGLITPGVIKVKLKLSAKRSNRGGNGGGCDVYNEYTWKLIICAIYVSRAHDLK